MNPSKAYRQDDLSTSSTTGTLLVMDESRQQAELIAKAVDEVDESLLEWSLGLSVLERLRAASTNAAALERLARAASTNR